MHSTPPARSDNPIASPVLETGADPVLRREVIELGREALGGAWTDRQIETDMGAALRRAEAAARGELVEWPPGTGQMTDPRYQISDETCLRWLGVTAEERSALPADGQWSRASLSARQSRRGARGGKRSGEVRRDAVRDRDAQIAELRASGCTVGQLAKQYRMTDRGLRKCLSRQQLSE